MGIPLKTELGKYLGHHIATKARDRERHKELLNQLRGKFEGWKRSCLSRVGRITLAHSVLWSIPTFNMHSWSSYQLGCIRLLQGR